MVQREECEEKYFTNESMVTPVETHKKANPVVLPGTPSVYEPDAQVYSIDKAQPLGFYPRRPGCPDPMDVHLERAEQIKKMEDLDVMRVDQWVAKQNAGSDHVIDGKIVFLDE